MSKQVCVASKIEIWGEKPFHDVRTFLPCNVGRRKAFVNFESQFMCVSIKFPTRVTPVIHV